MKLTENIPQRMVVIILTMFASGMSYAIEPDTPLELPGATKVTAEQLIELASSRPDLVIVDSRIAGDRQKGFIESSVSLPNTKTNCQSLASVLPKKKSPALFYCNGVKCGRSAKAIKIAVQCGYTNLYWFRGGFEVWLNKGLPYMKD